MKYYILKHKDNRVDGEYLNGITVNKPIVMTNEEETLDPNYIEVEMEETDDRYVNQIFYKVKNGEIVKMTDEEFNELYPNYGVVVSTDIELTNQRTTDLELDAMEASQLATDAELERMELAQRITDLELYQLEGGVENV